MHVYQTDGGEMSRFDYSTWDTPSQETDKDMTIIAKQLESIIEALPRKMNRVHALTKLEESIMWARKGIRDWQNERERG
jgi:hypothetical protein